MTGALEAAIGEMMAASPAVPAPAPPPVAAPSSGERLSSQERFAQQVRAAMTVPAATAEEGLPEPVQVLRGDPSRKLFPAASMYASVPAEALYEGSSNAQADAASLREIFADHGANQTDAAKFMNMAVAAKREPPTDEQVDAWGKQATETLRLKYGDRLDAMLTDARRLAARDPRVSDFLLRSGLGSHPEVVTWMVEKAQAEKAAGRLK